MNERIRQLAEQADKWSQTMTWSSDPKYGDMPVSDLFNEKFAELIVEQCAAIIESQDVDPSFKLRMSWAVKQYFGVKS